MTRVRLSGVVPVALAPAEAFALFTPRGEERWAPGWAPQFPADAPDDTEPGTVFEVEHDGRQSTWIVTACTPGESIAYARVEPGRAGTVSVVCKPTTDGTTVAHVDYDLTALTPEGSDALTKFAEHYDRFLDHWREAIAEAGRREAGPPAA